MSTRPVPSHPASTPTPVSVRSRAGFSFVAIPNVIARESMERILNAPSLQSEGDTCPVPLIHESGAFSFRAWNADDREGVEFSRRQSCPKLPQTFGAWPEARDRTAKAMAERKLTRLTIATLVALSLGVAFARDEDRGERVRGDDDPVLVPRSVALGEVVGAISIEPETTGSTVKGRAKKHPACDRFAFYPDREPQMQFQDAC
jgi:hypothetical protein